MNLQAVKPITYSVALIDENNRKISGSSDGEIVFSGPQLTLGYLNDSEKTKQSFVKFDWDHSDSIWYKTGDLGFINSDGDMECIGRKDNQIKVAGRRIEIGEIEDILSKFDLTSGAVVVPLRDSSEIVYGCAAFTLNTIEKTDIIDLRKRTQSLLDSIFFPKYFFKLENFPLMASGKTDRKSLAILALELMEISFD